MCIGQSAHATDPSTDRNLGSSKELDAGDGEDKMEAWMERPVTEVGCMKESVREAEI